MYSGSLERWNISLYAMSVATNIIGTGLIVFGIRCVAKWFFSAHPHFAIRSMIRLSSFGTAMYTRLLALVVESGMVYSLVMLVAIILYVKRNNSFFIVYELMGQLSVRSWILYTFSSFQSMLLVDNACHDFITCGAKVDGGWQAVDDIDL
jgi:hypothetical protein